MQISQGGTCVGVFFIKVAGPQNCNFIKKRLQCRFFPVKIAKNFKNILFYRTSPVASSDSFRFPACISIKKETPAKLLFCEFCKHFKNIFFFWQNTSGWLLLVFICEFWEVFQNTFFIKVPLGNCLFHVEVAEFQPLDTMKNISQVLFKHFKSGKSHSKAFMYLKSLEIICEEVHL